MKALQKFNREIDTLQDLYLGTIFSYSQARDSIRRKIEGEILQPDKPFKHTISSKFERDVVANDAESLFRRLKREYPPYLREVIFVRVISALEVFLIDRLREIYTARPDLFGSSEKKIEISSANLLAYKSISEIASRLINDECRSLQSAGFDKIISAYKSRLGCDLSLFPQGLTQIREYHARRHLLVHRLGYTDLEYRHSYSVEDERLYVPKDYLHNCFTTMHHFVTFVYDRTEELFQNRKQSVFIPPKIIALVHFSTVTNQGTTAIQPKQMFLHGESMIAVGDVLHSFDIDDRKYTVRLKGHRNVVESYYQFLKELEANSHIVIAETQFLPQIAPERFFAEDIRHVELWLDGKTELSPSRIKQTAEELGMTRRQVKTALKIIHELREPDPMLDEVEAMLGEEPWGNEVRITVASQLNISESDAHRLLLKVRLRQLQKSSK